MRDSAWKTLSTNNSAFLDATFKKEIVVLGNLNKKDDQKEKWLSDAVQKIHLKTFASANSQSNQFIFQRKEYDFRVRTKIRRERLQHKH